MSPAQAEKIRKAAQHNGRLERRAQGIPDQIEATGLTATVASLLCAERPVAK